MVRAFLAVALSTAVLAVEPPGMRLPVAPLPEAIVPAGPLLALKSPSTLREVDRDTLQPVSRRRVRVRGMWSWGVSPDRRAVAFGISHGRIRIVRTQPLRAGRVVQLRESGQPAAVAWPLPELITVISGTGHDEAYLARVDARRGRPLEERPLGGPAVATFAGSRWVAAILGPPRGVGSARLVAVAPDGRLVDVALPSIAAGFEPPGDDGLARSFTPGLALDERAERAFVVAPERRLRVVAVDLQTAATSEHVSQRPSRLLTRLEGEAHAKGMAGSSRHATWLGAGRLLVSGWDDEPPTGRERYQRPRGIGMRIVDVNSWRHVIIDRPTHVARVGAGLLLAEHEVFSPSGRHRLRAPRSQWVAAAARGRVYLIDHRRHRTHVYDARTLRHLRTLPTGYTPHLIER